MNDSERLGVLLNGALIALGAAGVLDTLLVHWALGLHRAVPGPSSDLVEAALFVLSAVILAVGLLRERRARAATAAKPNEE